MVSDGLSLRSGLPLAPEIRSSTSASDRAESIEEELRQGLCSLLDSGPLVKRSMISLRCSPGKISEVLLSENRIELEVEIIHFPCYSMDCKPLLGCQVAEDIGG